MLEIKKKYPSPRKSVICESADKINIRRADIKRVVPNWTVCLTAAGTVKFLEQEEFDEHAKKKIGANANLSALHVQAINCASDAGVWLFTDLGNCVKVNLENVEPQEYRSAGVKLESLADGVEKGERPVKIFAHADKQEGDLLFFTRGGVVKRTPWSEYELNKSYFPAVKLKNGDRVLNVENFNPDEYYTMLFVTKNALCLNADKESVPSQGRVSGGVRGIGLNDGDEVLFATQQNGEGEVIVVTTVGGFKRVISSLFDPHGRGSKGMMIADMKGKGEVLFADYVTIPYSLAVVSSAKTVVELDTEKIPIENRVARGKAIEGISDVQAVYAIKHKSEYSDGNRQLKF